MTTIQRTLLLVVALGALVIAGCGDDEAPPPKPKKAAAAAPKKAAAPRGAAKKKPVRRKKGDLVVYPRIDDKYRRPLAEPDFLPDLTGEERRDPFQSFVVRQGGRSALPPGQGPVVAPTDVCTAKNTKASGFLLRDMRLIGIVLRGTNSFAQFRDKSGFGWIVRRGDCLGKEKAIVQAVGVGSVTLEVIPETPPNAPPPQPQRQDIALYPNDLEPTLGTEVGPVGEESTGAAVAPAPTAPTAPAQ